MDATTLILSLVSGAVGGNILGSAWKEKTLGGIGNTIAGLVGGVAGAYIMQAVGMLSAVGGADLTLGQIASVIAAGGVGGAVLQGIIGVVKGFISRGGKSA